MNLVLLGASGATGSQVLKQALTGGHHVTALVRSPSKLTLTHDNLTVLQGDATNSEDLIKAMAGNTVLISSLGSAKNMSVISDSTRAIVAACNATDLKRVIMMSSFAVNKQHLTKPAKFVTGIVMKKMIVDKSSGESLLMASPLDWTIVYASILTNSVGGKPVHVIPEEEKIGLTQKISRQDVATWLLKAAEQNSYVKQAVGISQ